MTSSGSAPVQAYHSDRHFQFWRYEVSHSQLLLRSVKASGHDSRIDVLFKAVDSICMPTSFDGLSIERDGDSFTLSGRQWEGSITTGSCYQAEDGGEYFDPSPFEASF